MPRMFGWPSGVRVNFGAAFASGAFAGAVFAAAGFAAVAGAWPPTGADAAIAQNMPALERVAAAVQKRVPR
jgi:hypothetical protein